jgi:hypothetical protein
MKLRTMFLFLLMMCVAVIASDQNVASDQNGPNPMIFQPNENMYGLSYGDWTAAWWQYVMQYTNDINPYFDTTGSLCNEGQGGPVFYLVGSPTGATLTTRYCTVPAGKALLIPLINGECSTIEPGGFHIDNASQGHTCAEAWVDGLGTISMTIDGYRVKDLTSYRFQSPFYYFNVPPDNNFTGTVGPTEAWSVSDGYWVMVKPLKPGVHVIHVYAKMVGGLQAGAIQNFTYVLTIQQ